MPSPASSTSRSSSFTLALAALFLFAGSLVACDDTDTPPDPCVGDDCTPPPCEGDDCGTEIRQCLAIATSAADDGTLDILDLDTLTVYEDITSLHSDIAFASDADSLYVLNRYGQDNLQTLSKDHFGSVYQYTLGEGANPQVLAVHGERGFIPLYDSGTLAVVNLKPEDEANFLVHTIALDPIGPTDGEASEPANAIVHDGVVYVLLQGLNGWSCDADGFAQLRAFDADTYAPAEVFDGESSLDLNFCNAEGLVLLGDTLYIQSIGDYRAYSEAEDIRNDGGIEAVDLSTGEYLGVVLDEAAAGDRDIFQMYPAASGEGLWITLPGATDFNDIDVHHLDLSGEAVVLGASVFNQYVWGIVDYDGVLLISGRLRNEEGIWLVRHDGTFVAEDPIMTSMPPRNLHRFEREGSCF